MKLAPRRMLRCDAGRNIPRRQGTQKVIGRFLVQIGLADLNMEERPMKVILLAGTVAASTAFGAYAAAGTQLSQAECDSLWNQANPAGASAITESQAHQFVTDFKAANPDGDGSLDQNEFAAACKAGLVRSSASSGAASGETGEKMAPAEKLAPATKLPPKGY